MASLHPSSPGRRLRRFRRAAGGLRRGILACLGPGLISGASDDDPSGIATYSQAGAQFGYGLLWTTLFSLPLVAAIQEISARIGRTTGRGLARNMRLHYPRALVYPLIVLLIVANLFNLGADIGAMGESLHLLTGGPGTLRILYAVALTAGAVLLQLFLSYVRYTAILKYLTIILLVYVITAFVVHVPWTTALAATVWPAVRLDRSYVSLLVAVLGTTISPYLFFWQASLESERVKITPGAEPLTKAPEQTRGALTRIRLDTYIGMAFSNAIALFVMLCAATTLYHDGQGRHIDSAAQAAAALAPLAGRFASALFALGILSGGLLAVPSMAGSIAFAVGELFHWPVGLERTPSRAKGFYGTVALSTLFSIAIVLSPINPIEALVWSAVLNGLAAVPIMVMVMLLFSNRQVMGPLTRVSQILRLVGWLATAAMAAAAVALFAPL
jgi:NRAMP (natural resistance-associated macrophage protein)-like metal ion transporter